MTTPAVDLDAVIAEYNLSLAHGDLSGNLEDADVLNRVLNRIYKTWPESFEQIDTATRVLSRMVLRDNRARNFLAQELKRLPTS
jgi:hypothetical protein